MALEILFWSIAAAWGAAVLFALLGAWLLPDLPAGPAGGPLPTLSVVVPARDEEEGIEAAVVSHCTQDFPGLQVIVVDDGSTDRTPEILRELAARHPNLSVLRCPEPPPGWLGKTHALHVGLQEARGELVLFADADVRYAPGAHARCAALVAARNLDMLVLLPHQEGRGLGLLVVSHLDAVLLYGMPSFLYNVPRAKAFALGCGAGNLVRRRAFDATGGFEALRGEVVDDITLGRRMKALRGRFRVVKAYDAVGVQMYGNLRAAIEGFSKNLYAFMGYSPLRAAAAVLAGWLVYFVPLAALLAAPWLPRTALLPAAIAVAAQLGLDAAMCRFSRYPLWIAPLAPLRAMLWNGILLRSAWRYYTKGLVWRGRNYGKGNSEFGIRNSEKPKGNPGVDG